MGLSDKDRRRRGYTGEGRDVQCDSAELRGGSQEMDRGLKVGVGEVVKETLDSPFGLVTMGRTQG